MHTLLLFILLMLIPVCLVAYKRIQAKKKKVREPEATTTEEEPWHPAVYEPIKLSIGPEYMSQWKFSCLHTAMKLVILLHRGKLIGKTKKKGLEVYAVYDFYVVADDDHEQWSKVDYIDVKNMPELRR